MGELDFRPAADAFGRAWRYRRPMLVRLNAALGGARVRRVADVVLAAGLAVSALADALVAPHHGSGWYGPSWLRATLGLIGTLPLAWRARRPLPVFVLVLLGSGGLVLLAGSRQGPFEIFVALVVAAYSVGAHTDGRLVPAGLVLVVVPPVVTAPIAIFVLGQQAGNVLPTVVWLGGFWIVGRVIRTWRTRAIELADANRLLAAQRGLQAQAAVVVERGRIARELHDVVGHNVSMMVVQAGAAARVLEGEQPNVRGALTAIEQTGRQTVDEMRRLIGVVRSDDGLALAPQPTLADLEQLAANVRDAGLPVEVRIEGLPTPLPPGVDLSAYRIVQEALTNTLKHAGPARATVTVRYEPSAVEVEVCDDGDGSGTGAGTGNGLIGMRERVALWGGELEAGRRGDRGFAIRARLPVGGTS